MMKLFHGGIISDTTVWPFSGWRLAVGGVWRHGLSGWRQQHQASGVLHCASVHTLQLHITSHASQQQSPASTLTICLLLCHLEPSCSNVLRLLLLQQLVLLLTLQL
jgi:hypothetical protein